MTQMISRRHRSPRDAALKPIPEYRTTHPLGATLAFQGDSLNFLSMLFQRYGNIVQFRLLTLPVIVINHPDYVKHVLHDKYTNYDKDVILFHLLRPILGNGLVTNIGGTSWLHQRRLMQPAFHRQRIAALGTLITDLTLSMLESWETKAAQDQTLDVAEEMMDLTLQIVSKALFSQDISDKSSAFGASFAETNKVLTDFSRFPFPPLNFPTPSHRRLWAAVKQMDSVAYEIIRQRHQNNNEDRGDLLSMLLLARDEETGEGMSDQQLRDEVMTLLLAGHETSANALSWTWYMLSQHPEAEQRLHDEVDRVLAGRVATIEDLPRLSYTRMVIDETMRLRPPIWQLMRRAREADEIDGYAIPARSTLFWSQYIIHRHPDFWQDPERFDPERFAPEQVANRHRFAYIPFSAGPRMCIGSSLAMTEMQLALATIAQRYRLVLDPQRPVDPLPTLALRPKGGVHVRLVCR